MYFGANELLEYGNHPNYTKKSVVIIGGGNVAIDAARTIKRLGASEVTVSYRRGKEQMPAEEEEVLAAEKDGIKFLYQTKVLSIKNGTMELIRTKLEKINGEDRMVPVELPNSNFSVNADYVVTAIGSKLDSALTKKLKTTPKGYIKIDDNYETSIPNVYAAGDCIGEEATVAWACQAGKKAAEAIIRKFETDKL